MLIKDNHPQVRRSIQAYLDTQAATVAPARTFCQTEKSHGRLSTRTLRASSGLAGWFAWPGLAQVFEIERVTLHLASGKRTCQRVLGVTDLPSEQASPAALLTMVRGHWHIENKSHHVRDVTFDEDRCRARTGTLPQVLAALRNAVIGCLRVAGHTNIARACRLHAADPRLALQLIGVHRTSE